MNHQVPGDIREKLEQQKIELSERISKIKADVGSGLEADSSEQAAQLENMEVLNALVAEGQQELEQVNAALQRVDEGSYGLCASCGEPINPERLDARPYALECIKCASNSE